LVAIHYVLYKGTLHSFTALSIIFHISEIKIDFFSFFV